MEILAMKAAILDSTNNKIGEIKLPSQFEEEYRPDLIHRAVLAIQSHKRQGYAASETAGKRASAKLSRRRRDYRGSYGIGISRVPRKIMTRRGTRMNWVGAFAPGTVGGRRAHPPKSEKIWWKKINKKEKAKAISRAVANIPGIDVVDVKSLNTELLAPGAKAGRLVLWTAAAVNILEKENLFK